MSERDGNRLADALAGLSPGSAPQRCRHNVPTEHGSFFGRDDELARVLEYLRPYPNSQYPAVALDGVGGVGKTALALRVANHFALMESNSDDPAAFAAVVWTSAKSRVLTASGIKPQRASLRNVNDIIHAIARTLGRPDIQAASSSDQYELARLALAEHRVLLVIDNLETVDDPQVGSFIRDVPAPTKVLITTRHRIDGAVTIRLEGLSQFDSEALLRELAKERGVDLSDVDAADLAEASSGVPLALHWTIGQLAFGRSTRAAVDSLLSAKGEYAEFCFGESVRLLESMHKEIPMRVLMALSYFVAGANREAVGFVGGLTDTPELRDQALDDLVRLSLVNVQDGRYRLTPLTREFVLTELARDREFRQGSDKRLIEHTLSITSSGASGGADLSQHVVDHIAAEYDNILWALDAALAAKNHEEWVQMIRGMEFYWLGNGEWQEFERNLGIARVAAPDPLDRIHFTLRLAWLAVLRGELEKAAQLLESADLQLRTTPSKYEEMRLHDFRGQLHLANGSTDAASSELSRSLAIADELGDGRGQFACLKYLGEVSCASGNLPEAEDWLSKAEAVLDGLEQRWLRGIAHSLHLRGVIELKSERYSEAASAFRTALENLFYWPDVRLLTKVRGGLADALMELEDYSGAREALVENRTLFLSLGMRKEVGAVEEKLQIARELESQRS